MAGRGRQELSDGADSTRFLTLLALVGAFVGSAVLSTVTSGTPLQSLIRGAWTPLLLAGVLVYAIWAHALARWVRPALTLLLLTLCAGSLWQVWTGWHLEAGRIWRAHGFLPHPNDTALAALLAPLLSWWGWPLAAGLILLSGSRTALVGLAVAAVYCLPGWRTRLVVVATTLGALVFVVHAAAWTSLTSRMGAWVVAWRMVGEAPWLGHGPQSFVDYYLMYLPRTLPFGIEPNLSFIPWAHNLYLEILAERGLLGFAVCAGLVALAWRSGDRAIRAGLAALLVMGLVDLTFLKPWVVAATWGLVALALTGPRPASGLGLIRVCDWPAGWTHRRQVGGVPNGIGLRIRAWTYLVTWGPGPYLAS